MVQDHSILICWVAFAWPIRAIPIMGKSCKNNVWASMQNWSQSGRRSDELVSSMGCPAGSKAQFRLVWKQQCRPFCMSLRSTQRCQTLNVGGHSAIRHWLGHPSRLLPVFPLTILPWALPGFGFGQISLVPVPMSLFTSTCRRARIFSSS
jgi:hypothetical protein